MEQRAMTIRPAVEADVPVILECIRELAKYEHMEEQVTATEELLQEWLFRKKKASVLLLEAEGKNAGFALYFYNFSTFLGRAGIYLEDLYIKPEYRGQGGGRALLRALAAKARAEGCGRLEWCCLDWNTPSIAFYKSLGAEAMEEWTTYRLAGETLDRMEECGGEETCF